VAPRKPVERGERFDADVGLHYLNARYYDPKLGLFTQPDWWEVTKGGWGRTGIPTASTIR
jgi:RHS repeat-associated protein